MAQISFKLIREHAYVHLHIHCVILYVLCVSQAVNGGLGSLQVFLGSLVIHSSH